MVHQRAERQRQPSTRRATASGASSSSVVPGAWWKIPRDTAVSGTTPDVQGCPAQLETGIRRGALTPGGTERALDGARRRRRPRALGKQVERRAAAFDHAKRLSLFLRRTRFLEARERAAEETALPKSPSPEPPRSEGAAKAIPGKPEQQTPARPRAPASLAAPPLCTLCSNFAHPRWPLWDHLELRGVCAVAGQRGPLYMTVCRVPPCV
ncbi:uncharacterized protein LOC102492029 [Tupaia chinensis]|uniref:uncharacterized protein LOC102492029 n=1 Tax=Tupaia chinensis TaxID=246437 RepID=UPI0003C8DB8C|nr:uncharacterized protein LOC102492029 [Tupaia chinensis]